MALFNFDNPPSTEELLLDPAVLRLLEVLLVDFTCLSTGHIHQLFRSHEKPSAGAHRTHNYVRFSILDKLEEDEYLGSAPVKWLPPATIGNGPLFRLEKHKGYSRDIPSPEQKALVAFGDEPVFQCEKGEFGKGPSGIPTAAELRDFIEIAKHRVPPLEAHRPARFYFATAKSCELMDKLNPNLADYGALAPRRADLAMQVIERHQEAENDANPSPIEIAATDLTAMSNIAQLLFWERFQTVLTGGENRLSGRHPFLDSDDGRLFLHETVTMFFLRPLLPHQIRKSIEHWVNGAGASPVCWWL